MKNIFRKEVKKTETNRKENKKKIFFYKKQSLEGQKENSKGEMKFSNIIERTRQEEEEEEEEEEGEERERKKKGDCRDSFVILYPHLSRVDLWSTFVS